MTDSEIRFDDEQVGLILRRATELAATGGSEGHSAEGLSLAELEQIAVEAGIDPHLIRRAAEEVSGAGDNSEWSWVLGAPVTISVHRIVDAEVPEDFFDDLLADIHTAGLAHGTASLVGRTLSWKGTGAGQNPDSVHISISSRDGRTEIHAERKRSQAMGGLLGGLVGGGGLGVGMGLGMPVGIALFGSPLAAASLPVLGVGGAYMLARKLFQSGDRKRRGELERLLDKLGDRIRREAARRQVEPPSEQRQITGDS